MAVDTYIFPLVSQTKDATLALPVSALTDTGEIKHNHVVDSRTLKIDADGNNNGITAVTHTVNISGPTGLVFLVDFLDNDSLAANGAAQAATSVKLVKGDNEVLLDAIAEQACLLLTETGFVDGSDLLLIGATSDATFS
jgi:hypothetical protein